MATTLFGLTFSMGTVKHTLMGTFFLTLMGSSVQTVVGKSLHSVKIKSVKLAKIGAIKLSQNLPSQRKFISPFLGTKNGTSCFLHQQLHFDFRISEHFVKKMLALFMRQIKREEVKGFSEKQTFSNLLIEQFTYVYKLGVIFL